LFNIVPEGLATAIKHEEEIMAIQVGKKEVILPLVVDVIVHRENSIQCAKN
jgi:hypothetical protein